MEGLAAGKHIPALDGVRGLAILMVIAFHSRVVFSSTTEIPYFVHRLMALGWAGVDLFFVLSGFLITGILLDSRDSPDYFQKFYLRRVLRIFPLYFAYLFFVLVVLRFAWLWHSGRDLWAGTNAWWYVSYLSNWKSDHGFDDLYLGHVWSLSIEEQFYLVWPAIVWAFPRDKLKWLCLVLAALGLSARFWMPTLGFSGEAIYRMTPPRMDTLALGAFAAIGFRDFRASMERWAPWVCIAGGFGILELWYVTRGPVWSDAPVRTYGVTLIAVVGAAFIVRAATHPSGRLHRFLCLPGLRACGKYSYAMYVLHLLPFQLTAGMVRVMSGASPLVLALKYLYFPALAGLAFAVAWVSWRVLESPFLRLKERWEFVPSKEAPVRFAVSGAAAPQPVDS
jgi:peptidoglycan/LPS O-acetylase OafA/YrhL